MEQRQNDPSTTSSDSVENSPGGSKDGPLFQRHFWLFLLATILLSATLTVGVVYTQYEQVDQTLGSVPYAEEIASSVPYFPTPGDSTSGGQNEPREYGSFTKMEDLVVNPAGSGGDRYLAASLAFESQSPTVVEEIESKKIVVRDAILTVLSERSVKELSAPDQRDELKTVLRKETNRILSSGTVDRLYFTEFVLQ